MSKLWVFALALQGLWMPLKAEPQRLPCARPARNVGKVYLWIDFKADNLIRESDWGQFAERQLACEVSIALESALSPLGAGQESPIEVVPIKKPDADHVPCPSIRVTLYSFRDRYWLDLNVFFANVGPDGGKVLPAVDDLLFNTETLVPLSRTEGERSMKAAVLSTLRQEAPGKPIKGFGDPNLKQLIWRIVKLGIAEPISPACPPGCRFDLQLGWQPEKAIPIAKAYYRIQASQGPVYPAGDLIAEGRGCIISSGRTKITALPAREFPISWNHTPADQPFSFYFYSKSGSAIDSSCTPALPPASGIKAR